MIRQMLQQHARQVDRFGLIPCSADRLCGGGIPAALVRRDPAEVDTAPAQRPGGFGGRPCLGFGEEVAHGSAVAMRSQFDLY